MRHWLIEMRVAKGWPQKKVAELSGISRSYYSGIELGTRTPSAYKAKKIAAALGFDWTIFFEDKGRETRHNTA